MGYFRFRHIFALGKFARINLSKSGASLSVGPRGASVNIGTKGVMTTVGFPGTGLSYRTRLASWEKMKAAGTLPAHIAALERTGVLEAAQPPPLPVIKPDNKWANVLTWLAIVILIGLMLAAGFLAIHLGIHW